jgi:hypothetical protein
LRRPVLEFASEHTQLSVDARKGLANWDKLHAEDRSVYKILARSAHGKAEKEP